MSEEILPDEDATGCIVTHGRGFSIHLYPDKLFYPADPRVEDCSIEGIFHSLSMQCRYKGNCDHFLSIAQHLVHCWEIAPEEFKREALLHDVSEGVSGLGDIPRPMKHMFPELVAHERRISAVIHPWLGIPVDMSPEVKAIDNIVLATEKKFNLIRSCDWGPLPEPLDWEYMEFWTPVEAEEALHRAFQIEESKRMGVAA